MSLWLVLLVVTLAETEDIDEWMEWDDWDDYDEEMYIDNDEWTPDSDEVWNTTDRDDIMIPPADIEPVSSSPDVSDSSNPPVIPSTANTTSLNQTITPEDSTPAPKEPTPETTPEPTIATAISTTDAQEESTVTVVLVMMVGTFLTVWGVYSLFSHRNRRKQAETGREMKEASQLLKVSRLRV